MRKAAVAATILVLVGGLPAAGASAEVSACNEVGDPACTIGGAVNTTLCAVTEVARSGGKPDTQELADCFNQTTGQ